MRRRASSIYLSLEKLKRWDWNSWQKNQDQELNLKSQSSLGLLNSILMSCLTTPLLACFPFSKGTEKLLSNIIKRLKNDYGMLLSCVNCHPLPFETREHIARLIIQNISSLNYVLFALLLYDNQVVAIIRPKKKQLHPTDIHLLINVITGLDTPKTSDFSSYPICLPNFDSSGIMYAYISYLDESCRTCLILLTGLCI